MIFNNSNSELFFFWPVARIVLSSNTFFITLYLNLVTTCILFLFVFADSSNFRVSTRLKFFKIIIEVCCRRARGMFRPCLWYVSTVLDVFFDCARSMFRPYLTELEVCIALPRGYFEFVLDPNPCLDSTF